MDNLAWFIFLAEISGNIKEMLCVLTVISFFGICALAVALIFILDKQDEDDMIKIISFKKYIKICVLSCFCFGLFYLAFPSTKTLAAMYVLPRIANNQDIQHTVNDNLKSLRFLSEKWLIELIRGNDKKGDK